MELQKLSLAQRNMMRDILEDTSSRFQADHGIAQPVTEKYVEELLEYSEECSEAGEEYWYVITNSGKEEVGYAAIYWIETAHRHADIMIHILPRYRRRGYAYEAGERLLSLIFDEMGMHKACCELMEGNEAYAGLIQKLGFTQDGFRSDMYFSHGRYYGNYYFSILEEEYRGERNVSRRELTREFQSPLGAGAGTGAGAGARAGAGTGEIRRTPYYWESNRIRITGMTEEFLAANREILDCREDQLLYISREMEEDDEVFADAEELLELNEDNDSIAYAIVDSGGTYIGNINLVGIDYVNGRFSYNIYVCREHRGKGYGTEALRMILGYAFLELRMHKMICNANWGNEASAAMMRSVGCHVEGVRRDEVKYEDKYVDMVMFGVTDREFAEKMGL